MMTNPNPMYQPFIEYSKSELDAVTEYWHKKCTQPLMIEHTFFITNEVVFDGKPLITQRLVDHFKNIKIIGRWVK